MSADYQAVQIICTGATLIAAGIAAFVSLKVSALISQLEVRISKEYVSKRDCEWRCRFTPERAAEESAND